MKKVLITYLSLSGHTATIAEYIAEGVRIAGHEAELKKITDIKKPEDMKGYDGYLLGSPTYHRDMPASMKTFLFIAKQAGLQGKAGGAFGSYTHSGDAPKIIFDTMEHVYKMKVSQLGSLNILEDKIDSQEFIKAGQDYAKSVCTLM